MRPLLVALALGALLALCAAQSGLKLEGSWKRTACVCSAPATNGNCDDIWITDYPKVRYSLGAWRGSATTKNLVFALGANEMTLSTPAGLLYTCHGAMGREIICENAARDKEFCRVTFECYDGDCVTTVVSRNMRSVMYPILGTVVGAAWVVVAVLSSMLPLELIITAVGIVINVLCFFLLVAVPVFPALMAMAFASMSLVAAKGTNWAKGLAIVAGIYVFMWFAGLHFSSNVNFFDRTMLGFLYDQCPYYLGISNKSARCAQYLSFTAFLGYIVTLLAPLQILLIMATFRKKD